MARPRILRQRQVQQPCLLRHLGHCERGDFQPSNVNYGLFLPLQDAPRRLPRREKVSRFAERAFDALEDWKTRVGGVPA